MIPCPGKRAFASTKKAGISLFPMRASAVSAYRSLPPRVSLRKQTGGKYDLDLQWRPKSGVLKGLWFRTRYACIDQRDGGPSQSNFRIVNYDIPLL